MIHGKKVVVVMPAYNAEKTLKQTFDELDFSIVDDVILVDDKSSDRTSELAKEIGIKHVITHEQNKGYGGNQKSCYRKALELDADITIMVHPDYQYTPKLVPVMAHMIGSGLYDSVMASRILGKGALRGGMPLYKYIANRFLTASQNFIIGQKLSEYHTGYRAFSKKILQTIDFEANSDDFVFDNQMICQIFHAGFEIAEVTCPTKYFEEASSINFARSTTYGIGVLITSLQYRLDKWGIVKNRIFRKQG